MCIIMAKPKGVSLPSKETFQICYNNNPDGCGYMYVEDGKVIIKKGFMGWKNMYKQIKKLGDEKAIVVHFRIGTSGRNDQKTTHPYPISNNVKDLQQVQFVTDVGMVHNGIIPGYRDLNNTELNDTQVFIRDFLSVIKRLHPTFYKYDFVQEMLEDITDSKLAFLDTSENIYYVGNFINEGGVLYSNNNFKYTWKNVDYTYYGYNSYVGKADKLLPDSSNIYDKYGYNETYGYDYNYDYDVTEINYDNYIELDTSYYISTTGEWFSVPENNKYGVDDLGNYFELQASGFPGRVLLTNVLVYDKNYEEVDF